MNQKRLLGGLILLAHITSGGANAQLQTQMRIDANVPKKEISPYIYGTNDAYKYAGSLRLGGNRLTSYNWENNASNAGSDYFQNSDDWLPWHIGVPDSIYNQPAAAIVHHHRTALQQGAYSLVTLPMADYVAADKNGPVAAWQAAPSNRWKQTVLRKNAPFSLSPNTQDGNVYLDEELNYLFNKFGKSNVSTGIKGFSLDNEPGLWSHSHPLLWGTTGVTVNQLMSRSINTAKLVKEMDPTAEVFGPALYGVTAYHNLQFASDWESVKGNNNYFIEYYLQKMREQHLQSGTRLLDVLDVHWYPETNFNHGNQRPTNNMHDRNSVAARLEMTRSLWDSTYVEPTWIGNDHANALLPLIPKLHSMIDAKYPDTKLAITEYSYMGINHVSGAIAQADALGIFGQQGLYMANYWGAVTDYIKSGFDIFRNYDGKGTQFGNIGLSAKVADRANASVFASIHNENDSFMQVIAINKNQDSTLTATIEINSPFEYRGARVWIIDSRSPNIRQAKNVRKIEGNTFTYDLPPMSIAHFQLTNENLFILPFVDTFYATTTTGYSDGKAKIEMFARVLDGDNNLDSVYIDLSGVGGSSHALMLRNGEEFNLEFTIPKNTVSGLKDIVLYAKDATANIVQDRVQYRVITKKTPMVIWDGDIVAGGEPYVFYDVNDTHAGAAFLEQDVSGGNKKPNTLHFHFLHDADKWNTAVWRFDPNPGGARDIREFGYIEFYIKSTAPKDADIEISFTDATANMNASSTVRLKADGYLNSFSPHQYSRVRIPVTQLGRNIDLSKVWQINLVVNTADEAFDVWIDDIAAYPFTNIPVQPKFINASINPAAAYADNETIVTLRANVSDPDSNINTVTADLSHINRGNSKKMVVNENGEYQTTFTIPKAIAGGNVDVRMTVTDKNYNFHDTVITLKINKAAQTEIIWDGDNIKTGGAWLSNDLLTTHSVVDSGGANQPKAMKIKLKHNNNDTWAAVVHDWNEGTNNTRIVDLSDKHYLSFNLKAVNAPSNFDIMFFIRDQYNRESKAIWLKQEGFVSTYGNDYQQVRIPLSYLGEQADIDLSEVTKIGFLSEHITGNEATFFIDDIMAGGSMVAHVDFAVSSAQCAKNGSINVNVNDPVPGSLQYYINGKANPAGLNQALFTNLSPGEYEITIKTDSGFIYRELVSVLGNGPLKVSGTTDSAGNVAVTVTGGSSDYTYSWSNGANTKDLVGENSGNYKLTVTDNLTGCTVKKTFKLVNEGLTLNLFPNPATDLINVNYELTEGLEGNIEIKVVDKFGLTRSTQIVYDVMGSVLVNIIDLPTDTYFLQVKVNGRTYTKTFVKL
jgi:hypothetical protein